MVKVAGVVTLLAEDSTLGYEESTDYELAIVDPIQTFLPWEDTKRAFHAPKTPRLHPPETELVPF